MSYGQAPEVIGNYPLEVDEMMLYLYMPVWTPEPHGYKFMADFVPEQLSPFKSMMNAALSDSYVKGERFDYWYITAKRMYVTPGNMGNRPGWHCDGYGTNDVNYVWCDCVPTEFALQEFTDLSPDHNVSMAQMHEQIDDVSCIVACKANDLLRLDQHVVHRVARGDYRGMRTFFKLTGSNSRFNLKGNTHNYLMDYDWPMFDRQSERNMESAS
ncbi:hypothetical protein [uncultured Paraglaciecola sp.]|uniref:hypothetical protein n=1 Tax=uncultured Paraglaciecola sp. TaxID=1765024 RepID=UPI0026211FF6|nr:hypothetical protein [uncultured Paraglaciecola sp.]